MCDREAPRNSGAPQSARPPTGALQPNVLSHVIASAQVGRVGWMEVSDPPEDGIVFIGGDEIHVLVRINSGALEFSH